MATKPVIGVLALQGDFFEHLTVLKQLQVTGLPVRTIHDAQKTQGLILPGGESTTIGKLLTSTGLDHWITQRARRGYPLYGTCAGCIILEKLGLINIHVLRNAYGRQLDSFEAQLDSAIFPGLSGVFIRAPKIISVGKNVEILASHEGEPVLVQQSNILAGTFHPELTDQLTVHQRFVDIARRYQRPNTVQHQKR